MKNQNVPFVEVVNMDALESFGQRVRRLRVARGLSERALAERIGMTVHQYERATSAGMSPTCSLLVDLADTLDVSITVLTERTVETAPPAEEMEAFLQERRRTRMIIGTRRVDRRLAKVDEALDMQPEPSADALNAFIALMRAIDRNEPLRAVASRYARLVLQRCAGKKGAAGRVLGIHHHTLREYLRHPADDDSRALQVVETTIDSGRIIERLAEDRAAAPVAS